jgi:hypothetical protein
MMKLLNRAAVLTAGLIAFGALADFAVVPPLANGLDLGSSNQGAISGNADRRYMIVMDASALSGIPAGSRLTGVRFRYDNARVGPWPAVDVTISNYQLKLSPAATSASTISTNYASNVLGTQVMVKNFPVFIPAGSYGAANSGTVPEAFGPPVDFDTPYVYEGGSLCVDINYSGTGLVSEFMDASSTPADGVRALFSNVSRTALTGNIGSANVVRFEYTPPENVVVPASLANVIGPSNQEGTIGGTGVRRFQYNISESALGAKPGDVILGMAFRLEDTSLESWPPSDVTIADYEVRLSSGIAPGSMTTTYANNIAGTQKLVADGSLAIEQGIFQADGATPRQYGLVIMFDTPYAYFGGDVCVDINHTGTGLSNSQGMDATQFNDFGASGVRGLYSNVSRTALTGTLTNAPVTRFLIANGPGPNLAAGTTKVFVPHGNASAEANSQLNSLAQTASRTVQTVASADQFDTIGQSSDIIGHSARAHSASATGPAAPINFASYNIELARAVNPPSSLSTTFSANMDADVVSVRSGALSIPANSFAGDGANSRFTYTFGYSTPYRYTGGPLAMLVRHSGNGSSSFSLDAVGPGDGAFGTLTNCLNATNASAVSGGQISATVLRYDVDAGTKFPLDLGVGFSGAVIADLLGTDDYTLQIVLSADQLSYIPRGSVINSLGLRNFGLSLPASATTCPDFELTLSSATVPISGVSTTFADNEGADKVLAHDGILALNSGALPASGAFGDVVRFQRGFVYKGGPLCVTIRHRGFLEDSANADATPATGRGYALYATSFDSAVGAQLGSPARVPAMRFGYIPSVCVPNSVEAAEGDNGLNILSGGAAFQLIIPASQLGSIDVGSAITGLSFRNSSTGQSPSFPESDFNFPRFDVTMSHTNVQPLSASNTFAANDGPGLITVRSGPMFVPAEAFPASGDFVIPGENAWFVQFQRAFIYDGGNLCITVRCEGAFPIGFLDIDGIAPSVTGSTRYSNDDPNAAVAVDQTGLLVTRLAFTARAFCPWDLDNDGLVNDADFVLFLASYNTLDCFDGSMSAGCPSDFNGDSVVNDDDFLPFLVAYNELVCP